ncbi:MAG: hypothetical protein CSA76_02010 [Spirochaetales bacterium]|nr:MAG: hypothetical protein CSA76_02010 [Spirochaetales bacterium]
MGLMELLNKELIKVPMESVSKDKALEELVDVIDAAGMLKDRNEVLKAVMERELQQSTGLGEGIAIPHARTEAVNGQVLCIGVAPGGIDFDALDGRPSSLFFMILAPSDKAGAHIEVLSEIARVTRSKAFCRLLLSAQSAEEVLELFQEE